MRSFSILASLVLLISSSSTFFVIAAGDVKLFNCQNAPNICNAACYYDREEGGDRWYANGFNYDGSANKDSNKSKRRSAIGCNGKKQCSSGFSCDEYPFASTYQGGLGVVGGGYPTMRDGYNTCVPEKEQQSQGGQVGGWTVGKPDGYNYEPHVSNAGGIRNCDLNQTPVAPSRYQHVTTPQRRQVAAGLSNATVTHGYETSSGVKFLRFGNPDLLPLNTTVWTSDERHPEAGFHEVITRQFVNGVGFTWN